MNRILLAGLLIVAGIVFLLANLGVIALPPLRVILGLWPLLLVVAGIERLFARQRPQFALGLQTAAVALGVALIATQPLTHVTDKSSAIAGAPEVVVTATDFRFTPDELRLSADVANLTFRNDGVLDGHDDAGMRMTIRVD